MNGKVIILALCAVQLAAGFVVSGVLEGIEKLFNDVLDQTQTAIASIQDQSDGILRNFLEEAQSKIDDLVPTLESKIYSQFSEVVNAAPKIEACVEAEQQNISAIVDSAYKLLQPLIVKESLVTVPLVGNVNSTFDDVKAYLEQVTSSLETCRNQSLLSAVRCAANVALGAKDKAQSITADVKSDIQLGQQVLSQVLPDVTAAFDTIIQSAEEKFEDISSEIEKCVQTALQT